MNSVCLAEKLVSLTYRHAWRENRTALDCSVEFDPANKLAVNYALPTGCKVKYVYAHGEMPRRTVLEPSYDLSKNAWDFAVSRKFDGGDSLKATYLTSTKILGVEWSRDSKINGSFKVTDSLLEFLSLFFWVFCYCFCFFVVLGGWESIVFCFLLLVCWKEDIADCRRSKNFEDDERKNAIGDGLI